MIKKVLKYLTITTVTFLLAFIVIGKMTEVTLYCNSNEDTKSCPIPTNHPFQIKTYLNGIGSEDRNKKGDSPVEITCSNSPYYVLAIDFFIADLALLICIAYLKAVFVIYDSAVSKVNVLLRILFDAIAAIIFIAILILIYGIVRFTFFI